MEVIFICHYYFSYHLTQELRHWDEQVKFSPFSACGNNSLIEITATSLLFPAISVSSIRGKCLHPLWGSLSLPLKAGGWAYFQSNGSLSKTCWAHELYPLAESVRARAFLNTLTLLFHTLLRKCKWSLVSWIWFTPCREVITYHPLRQISQTPNWKMWLDHRKCSIWTDCYN